MPNTSYRNEVIWIIGASSGIGAAVARVLHNRGAQLVLSARRAEVLQQLNTELEGQHMVCPIDVADEKQVSACIETVCAKHQHIDRVLFMSAIYRPADIDNYDVAFARHLVEVNLIGALNVCYQVLPILKQQAKSQLVLCASIAGCIGLPGGQPYSATKAALINFAESLYGEYYGQVDIKVINPGFVRTRITDKNRFHMPMRIEPEEAAIAIAHGLASTGFEIHFPKGFTYIVKLLSALPYWLKLRLTRRLRPRSGGN